MSSHDANLTREFLQSTQEERIALLEKTQGPVILKDVKNTGEIEQGGLCGSPNYDWYFWHSALSPFNKLDVQFLISKYFQVHGTCNDKPISLIYDIARMAHNFQFNGKKIQDMAQHYESQGWLSKELVQEFALAVFTYADAIYGRPDSLYTYTLELCLQYEVDPIKVWQHLRSRQTPVSDQPCSNGIRILAQECLERGISREELSSYLKVYLARICPSKDAISLIDFCLQNNIHITSHMDALTNMIKLLPPEIDRYQRLILLYKEAGKFLPNQRFLVTLILAFSAIGQEPVNKLLDDSWLVDNIREFIGEHVLDMILFNGSSSLVSKMLEMGYLFQNKTFKLYVPCPQCYNGEGYDCNYRYISSDFVALSRFGICLRDLNTNPQGLPAIVAKPFWLSYGMLNNTSDEKELYVAPGQNELDWDEAKEQRIYEVPPVKVERDPREPSTDMDNNIPSYFSPIPDYL